MGEGESSGFAKVVYLLLASHNLKLNKEMTHLDSNLTININKLSIDELLLKLLNLGISERPSD